MEVLLIKDVKNVGQAGDVRRVADGYARNYLIPRGLAVPATQAARKQVADRLAAEARREAAEREAAEAQAEKLQGIEIVFQVKAGEAGRLYGSITNNDIAERLAELGYDLDKRRVLLEEPIKEIGRTEVDVRLHSEVKASVTVVVEAAETSD
ncbi:MAG TPA: 50S ribosomal protein L9 [Chloroflexi bacterium]|jgi:large subunit ribosomal protein L9|nr:50S ribosomal protein L9 [Chloroflexota bacterium]